MLKPGSTGGEILVNYLIGELRAVTAVPAWLQARISFPPLPLKRDEVPGTNTSDTRNNTFNLKSRY